MDNKKIKSSGETREFSSGAHRDSVAEPKGREDIMPLDVIADILGGDKVLENLWNFIRTQDEKHVIYAIQACCKGEIPDMMLKVAFHYEAGGKKYGYGNWTFGMPIQVYLDSGIRHYLKYLAGWDDENHHEAALWNFMNLVWTLRHVPQAKEEMSQYLEEVWHN